MHASHAPHAVLRHVSLASALLLTTLCALTLATGVSQQWFEWVRTPDAYATRLLHDAMTLRAIIALDDVFIAAHVASAVLFVRFLGEPAREPLHAVAVGFSVAAGVLDLTENHHLLSLLTLVEAGLPVPVEDIVLRSQLSQLKWMLGHVAFAFLGVGQRFIFGGTSLLIMVGVGLDTVKQIESQLQQRNYEGFLR